MGWHGLVTLVLMFMTACTSGLSAQNTPPTPRYAPIFKSRLSVASTTSDLSWNYQRILLQYTRLFTTDTVFSSGFPAFIPSLGLGVGRVWDDLSPYDRLAVSLDVSAYVFVSRAFYSFAGIDISPRFPGGDVLLTQGVSRRSIWIQDDPGSFLYFHIGIGYAFSHVALEGAIATEGIAPVHYEFPHTDGHWYEYLRERSTAWTVRFSYAW